MAFEAGTWTRKAKSRKAYPPANSHEDKLLDPATLSAQDFLSVAAAARAGADQAEPQSGWPDADKAALTQGKSVSERSDPAHAGALLPAEPILVRPVQSLFAGPGVPDEDPRIAPMTERILAISRHVAAEYAQEIELSGDRPNAMQIGNELHIRFRAAVDDARIPGIETEQSFKGGGDAKWGAVDSVRTDILLRDTNDTKRDPKGRIIAVWDFKTGATGSMPAYRR